MNKKKICSIFAICVGSLIIVMWLFFILAGMVPEFETKPAEIILHIIAEVTTGIMLLLAGIMILKKSRMSRFIYPLSMGMLIYTLIVSPGYYLQAGEYPLVVMFALLLIFAIFFIFLFQKSLVDEK